MDQIDMRIGQYLRGELAEFEEREFLTWLSKKPENQYYFEETKMIWEQAEKTREPFSPDVEGAWEYFLNRIEDPPSQKLYPLLYKTLAGIAASLLIMISVIYLIINKEAQIKYTAHGDRKFDIELPDGSVVWLNRNSEITFEESESSRQVLLVGEAYFEVNPDHERPFTINTDELTTKVIGTSFNVDAKKEKSIDVTVLSGKVALFNNRKDSVFLTEGEVGSFYLSSGTLTEKLNADLNFLAWKTGILTFDDTPMEQVIGVLEKHFDVNLEWDESNISRLTASFDNQSLEEIISLIVLGTDVEISISKTINDENN